MGVRWTVAASVAASLAAVWPPGAAPAAAAPAAGPGVVLREVRTWEYGAVPETLVTCLAPGQLRLSHSSGDAIVDVAADRLVILDRRTSRYHVLSFSEWERRIQEATAGADSIPAPRFEPIGDGGRIAGYACWRHHLFTRHEVFPGEFERVEAEIWVTDEIPLAPATHDTYRRVLASFDRVDFGAAVQRPPGLVLRAQLRHTPENPGSPAETETTDVLAVEPHTVDAESFAIPQGYVPADSLAREPALGGRDGR